jgi:hypothetical protein
MKELNVHGYKNNISTPIIGHTNHLHKNDSHNQINGKLDFDTFLKAVEIISIRLFSDFSHVKAVKYMINRHLLRLDEQIRKIAAEYKPTLGGASLITLIDLLKDSVMVIS